MRDLDKSVLTAIGVISGTSMDAIDVSIVESDGHERLSFGAGAGYAYPPETRRALQALVAEAERAVTEPLEELEAAVTAAHLDAVRRFMDNQGIKPESVSNALTSTTETPHSPDSPVGFSSINQTPPEPPPPAQSVQQPAVNGGAPPVIPQVPPNSPGRNAAGGAVRPPQPPR